MALTWTYAYFTSACSGALCPSRSHDHISMRASSQEKRPSTPLNYKSMLLTWGLCIALFTPVHSLQTIEEKLHVHLLGNYSAATRYIWLSRIWLHVYHLTALSTTDLTSNSACRTSLFVCPQPFHRIFRSPPLNPGLSAGPSPTLTMPST